MRIVMIGISHHTAPVQLRERVVITSEILPRLLAQVRGDSARNEAIILSTCNRTEIYVARPTHEQPDAEALRQILSEHSGINANELAGVTIQREQERAVRHLFRVCGGLDSMVLGEPQILGQIKRGYEAATEHKSVGPVLHKLFQDAIKAGKRLRTDTVIGQGHLSVGSVSVDLARQVFDRFDDKTIIAVGAGEMAKVTLRHLQSLHPEKLWLVNRSHNKALELAEQLNISGPTGGARPWQDLDELIVGADILITSTSATDPILTVDQFKPLVRRRRRRSLLILDLAVPRDVAPAVGGLANVYLYNVDDLQSVINSNCDNRCDQIEACEQQLAEAVGRCMVSLQHRDLGQLIRQLRSRLHDIGRTELERTMGKVNAVAAPDDRAALHQAVEEHTQRVVNKIMHLPLSQLDQRDSEASLGFYAVALRRLFDLEEPPDALPPSVTEAPAKVSVPPPAATS